MSTTDPRDPEDRRPPAPDDDSPRIYVASLTDYNAGTLELIRITRQLHPEWPELVAIDHVSRMLRRAHADR